MLQIGLAWGENQQAVIDHVIDGDTVVIQTSSSTFRLRLIDIDAPEINQPYGRKAKRALLALCKNRSIQFSLKGEDRYHRSLGELYCNQINVNTFMLEYGHAWCYRNSRHKATLLALEGNAKAQKRGLWSDPDAIPPWDWRQKYAQQVLQNSVK